MAQSLFDVCYKSNMQIESIIVLLLLADIHKVISTSKQVSFACFFMCQMVFTHYLLFSITERREFY